MASEERNQMSIIDFSLSDHDVAIRRRNSVRENLKGRVQRNTRLGEKRGLQAVFEAIINSIDAIQQSSLGTAEGRIIVNILRDEPLALDYEEDEEPVPGQIYGFMIQDNGIGFDNSNFEAFNEADTQYKTELGGKGVGRFLWLKVFEKAEIESVFMNDDGSWHRTFEFSLDYEDGIGLHNLTDAPNLKVMRTTVNLLGLKDRFRSGIPTMSDSIAEEIVQHCLEYFVLDSMPPISLSDPQADYDMSLQQIYKSMVASSKTATVEIDRNQLQIIHFMLNAKPFLKHRISYCANGRTVKSVPLANKIPHLAQRLAKENGSTGLVYAAYVSSKYLDARVNTERTGFDIAVDSSLDFPGDLTWEEIEDAVLEASREFLQPYTETVRTSTLEHVQDYVRSEAPQYRALVSTYPEVIDTIPPNTSTSAIDTKLHEAQRQKEIELRRATETFFDEETLTDNGELNEDKWQEFIKVYGEISAIGKASLAKYILHRKWMLQMLERSIEIQVNGQYSTEEAIHKIIFPIRSTSDEVSYEDHNLWILDEKLAYHEFLASDLPLNKIKMLESDSGKRPDLAIFYSSAIAVTDERAPFHSGIVIFEFKRPERDDYTDDENPIRQVKKYVTEMRAGKAKDWRGKTMNFTSATPFFCYIICDITPNLRKVAKLEDLILTPDEEGYIGYHGQLGALIQVISFNRLLDDAKKRNRILFDKLSLPV